MDGYTDEIQARLAEYAAEFSYEALTPQAINTAKTRVIDTLGTLVCGFFAEPCRIARMLAVPLRDGSTVIGTSIRTTPDLAAFANATAARYVEMTDAYHWGHPSDVIMPLLAVAERVGASGRDFIATIVLAYEVYQRMADVTSKGFDNTNFCLLGAAVGAAKLLSLPATQIAHCISMAAVSNSMLRQVRLGHQSMFKTVATGYMGRAAVQAALMAQAGMEGPSRPFQGEAGWCAHVGGRALKADDIVLGGGTVPFKILETRVKMRSSVGTTISSVLAAENIGQLGRVEDVERIIVEVYRRALDTVGVGSHLWQPESREIADHSIPYVVAVALMDGTVTPRSFDAAHLCNPQLHALMQKIAVVENLEFTSANERTPPEYPTRVTVRRLDGTEVVGTSGGDRKEIAVVYSNDQIADKFRGFTEEYLGATRVNAVLERLWRLEGLSSVVEIPPALCFA